MASTGTGERSSNQSSLSTPAGSGDRHHEARRTRRTSSTRPWNRYNRLKARSSSYRSPAFSRPMARALTERLLGRCVPAGVGQVSGAEQRGARVKRAGPGDPGPGGHRRPTGQALRLRIASFSAPLQLALAQEHEHLTVFAEAFRQPRQPLVCQAQQPLRQLLAHLGQFQPPRPRAASRRRPPTTRPELPWPDPTSPRRSADPADPTSWHRSRNPRDGPRRTREPAAADPTSSVPNAALGCNRR